MHGYQVVLQAVHMCPSLKGALYVCSPYGIWLLALPDADCR